jgi:hypothetical protein
MNIRQLQNLDPAGWTELLAQAAETRGAIVTSVDAEPAGSGRHLTRYSLTLADHSDPVTFVGKQTTATEALFYRHLADDLPDLPPRSWFTDVVGQRGWVIMADVPHDRPVLRWDVSDIDAVMQGLCRLHAAFWDMERYLRQYEWLPHFRTHDPSTDSLRFERKVAGIVSDHAMRAAARFAPRLTRGARGLQVLRRLEQWPQVFDDRHLRAAADLLDDPMPMLHPLRSLPSTLLHGAPDPDHWHLTLFDECYLFDWRDVFIGPAPYDVIYFVDMLEKQYLRRGDWDSWRDQQLFEQTTIDSYLLAMSRELGDHFPASETRQAMPGAICLFALTHWFPALVDFEEAISGHGRGWRELREMDEEALLAAGLNELAATRAHLHSVFNRFLQAYRTL